MSTVNLRRFTTPELPRLLRLYPKEAERIEAEIQRRAQARLARSTPPAAPRLREFDSYPAYQQWRATLHPQPATWHNPK